jgi:hypothetical protein
VVIGHVAGDCSLVERRVNVPCFSLFGEALTQRAAKAPPYKKKERDLKKKMGTLLTSRFFLGV